MGADAATIYAFRRNLVLAASAGTGKTHSLVGVLVHLVMGASELGGAGLRAPVDPGRIVATTFSRKAAAEIRTRLVVELEKLVNCDPASKYAADLDAALEGAAHPAWSAHEKAERARRALDGLARAQIGTLHGFAATIARRFALELGMSPGFELADESESRERTRAVIERIVSARAEDASVAALARTAGAPERLVALLEGLLARLEEEGRGAEQLIIASDDAERIDARMRELVRLARAASEDPRIGDRAAAVVAAWSSGDPSSLQSATLSLFEQKRTREGAATPLFDFRDALPRSSSDDNAMVARKLVASWRSRGRFDEQAAAARDVLAECERALRAESLRASSLGFGEVLRAARDVLRDHPDCARDLGAELDVFLVDEFQDTSRLQRDLVQLVWERDPLARAPGALASLAGVRAHGLFVVGDRKQSIYEFRGADVSVFAEFCVGLAGAPAREALGIAESAAWEPEEPRADFIPLRHNRRSPASILAFANAFSARRFRPAETPPALYEIAYAKDIEDLLPPDPRPTPCATTWLRVPAPRGASTRLDEAFAIAHACRRLIAAGEPRVHDAPPRWRDLAVLAQTNRMLDACAYAFAQAAIPFVVAGSGFHTAREVKDLVAMLALVLHPGDALSLLEVLRGPWVGVRDETLLALTDRGRGLADLAAWGDGERRDLVAPEDVEGLARARDVVLRLRRSVDRLGPAALLGEAVRALRLEEVLVQLPRGVQRVANVRKLLAMASRETNARVFLERLRDAADRETSETEAATFSDEDDAVRLLTVHASKGLDFPIVFVPEVGSTGSPPEGGALTLEIGCADAPTRLSVRFTDAESLTLEPPSYTRAMEEQRRRRRAERARVAYVAATRASHAMFFVGDRKAPKSDDTDAYAHTTAATLAELAAGESTTLLAVESAEVVPLFERVSHATAAAAPAAPPPLVPEWRTLSIATTSLQDYAHCPRRFQLVHLLEMPEPGPPLAGAAPSAARAEETQLDPRREGTLAHGLLERIDAAHFGGGAAARAELGRLLEADGLPRAHPAHPPVVGRVARFLDGAYAARVRAERAELARERPFVLQVEDSAGRTLALRGTIDLLVAWPDGVVDVIDYKRARGASPEPYAFQLEVYALAARELYPRAEAIRAGIVFLGGDASRPAWCELPDAKAGKSGKSASRLASLASRLVLARWSEAFPRVAVPRCRAIRCGYVALCHPETSPSSSIDA